MNSYLLTFITNLTTNPISIGFTSSINNGIDDIMMNTILGMLNDMCNHGHVISQPSLYLVINDSIVIEERKTKGCYSGEFIRDGKLFVIKEIPSDILDFCKQEKSALDQQKFPWDSDIPPKN